MNPEIMATAIWTDNSHLIYEVAQLGYISVDGPVLDATYGEGTFWKRFTPPHMVKNDLYKRAHMHADFRKLPVSDGYFDTVVFDPPYKLSGTPALGQFDQRYGIDKPVPWQERMNIIIDGAVECLRVTKPGGTLLVKCQDQVCSGRVIWQTDILTKVLAPAQKIDRFDFIYSPRAQRSQEHARRNTSQLLVFRKKVA